MARKAAAIPQLVRRNCRRFKPSRLPLRSANSLMRTSTFFWVALCEGGKYSPFDTIWVGIGVGADAASAPATRRCSRSLSQLPIVVLPVCSGDRPVDGRNGRTLHPECSLLIGKGTCRERTARERAANRFAHPQQRSRGWPDSAGNVKKSDLFRTRVVERMNRLGGGLQQDRATLFRKIRL